MRILACNPRHDRAIAYLVDGELVFSIEPEKDSKSRYSPLAHADALAAIGTATDAQRYFTGDPTIRWDVYAGDAFRSDTSFDIFDADDALVADLLENGLILGWSGR